MHPLLNIAFSAARQAGDIILRHIDQLDRVKITTKDQKELFSEVDVKAEQAIIHAIHKAHPDHGIIAEESGVQQSQADTVWLIDPLDGTNNYLHGFPFYAVSIAIQIKGRIEHGLVYDPLRHECFAASRGAGARLNDRRIRVSQQSLLSSAILGTGFTMRSEAMVQKYFPTLEAMFGKCAGLRRTGSAALDLAYVASGRLDGFWEFGLKSWDLAAGALLVREAGGFTCDPTGGEAFMKTGDIVAGNPKILKALIQTINAC